MRRRSSLARFTAETRRRRESDTNVIRASSSVTLTPRVRTQRKPSNVLSMKLCTREEDVSRPPLRAISGNNRRLNRPQNHSSLSRRFGVSAVNIAFSAFSSRLRVSAVNRLAGILLLLLATAALPGEIIDRIAVSVGYSVITTSDLDREIRVTAFLDGKQPDFTPSARRAAADRMVDQTLIRRELEISRYPVPAAAEIEPALKHERERFASEAAYRNALSSAGISTQDVADGLLWQLRLTLFIEERFRAGIQVSDQEISDYFDTVVKPAAEMAHPGKPASLVEYRNRIETTLTGPSVVREMDNWLQEARKRVEIVYRDEVFR